MTSPGPSIDIHPDLLKRFLPLILQSTTSTCRHYEYNLDPYLTLHVGTTIDPCGGAVMAAGKGAVPLSATE